MFKFNIKLLYFFGSNIVINNIYCTNLVKKSTIKLLLYNGKSYDTYLNNKEFKTDNNTFEDVLNEMGRENFFFNDKKFTAEKGSATFFKIQDITSNQIFFDKKSQIKFGHQYNLYFTNNYIDSKNDSTIEIQNKDNSNYTEYKRKYKLFIDHFKDISNENELKTLIYGLNKDISNDFKDINDIIDNYYIEKFTIYPYTIIDNNNPFKIDTIKKITKDYTDKKIEIKLSKFNKYSLNTIELSSDLAKIYKLKDLAGVITKINGKISKSRKKLTYGDIQNIITKDLKYDGIILNNNLTDGLTYSFYITIKEDSKNYFTEPKKCTITFVSNEFELEDAYKSPIEIIFDHKVNEDTKVQEYIFNTYKLNKTNCEIKNVDGSKVADNIAFSDGYQRNIIITKDVAGITKKKEADDVIINIGISSDRPDEFKLKDNVVKNKQIVLKKGNCKINDLLTNLKNNGYNGIEKDGIIEGFFLLTNPSNNIFKSTEDLIGGQYKILLSGQENNFVEKLVKKPSKKDITLTIVPKDETKYKLNEISNSISISVIENISYNDFVNEIKKIITDGKFEIYIDNINVKSGNIDINKQIMIKLLDDCNKLKEIKKDNDNDEDNKDDGDGKKDGDDEDEKGNESSKNNTKSTQKCQCSKK